MNTCTDIGWKVRHCSVYFYTSKVRQALRCWSRFASVYRRVGRPALIFVRPVSYWRTSSSFHVNQDKNHVINGRQFIKMRFFSRFRSLPRSLDDYNTFNLSLALSLTTKLIKSYRFKIFNKNIYSRHFCILPHRKERFCTKKILWRYDTRAYANWNLYNIFWQF